MAMTPKEFEKRMVDIKQKDGFDPENAHGKADDLMCELLRELGYGDGVKIFESMHKWYA